MKRSVASLRLQVRHYGCFVGHDVVAVHSWCCAVHYCWLLPMHMLAEQLQQHCSELSLWAAGLWL